MDQRVKDLFAAAADLPVEKRNPFLDTACGTDDALRGELNRLLAADLKNGSSIISAVETAAQSVLDQDGMIGSRIGAYRILHEIGRGGMGTVYLAVRADDHYQKQVAIKLIRRGMDTQDMLERFRHERQILADLEHPYIANLLDGGATPDGLPFLVMEYVRGERLDVYYRKANLGIRQRCELFLKVCEAVSFAHRNLIVHRDLKPGNILVSNDGCPKLLDFGLSKLLDPDANSGQTKVSARPLTPEYASPEMIRGEQITTAADVYSLGAILYELLSGEPAHRFANRGFRELERVVCEVDPPLASEACSSLRRQLRGDLDAILSHALRKEAAARYAAVDHLSGDLERYLNGWPVVARKGNVTYRARKFLRRNRAAIIVAGMLAGSLIAGATAATLQARRATREQARAELERRHAIESQQRAEASRLEADRQRHIAEEQRQQAELQHVAAEKQRQLAEHRFQQVRQLAGKFLIDFHDSIAKLPGSTPARKMVVETGLRYYDTLVKESLLEAAHDPHGNRELIDEIARGYTRLGDVQGNPYFASLGDLDGALASYRKALALTDSIADGKPAAISSRTIGNMKIAQMLTVKGDVKSADRTLRDTIQAAEQCKQSSAPEVREALAQAYVAQGDLWSRTGDHNKSLEPYAKHLALRKQMALENPKGRSTLSDISLAHTKLGDAYARLGRAAEALPHFRIVLPIDKQLAESDPNSVPRLRKVYVDYYLLGFVARTNPDLDYSEFGGPKAVLENAVNIAERIWAADPNNAAVLTDVLSAHSSFGDWLRSREEHQEAVEHYRKALEVAHKFYAAAPPNLSSYDALVQAHQRLASGLRETGELQESLDHLGKAEELLSKAEAKSPGLKRLAKRRAEIVSGRARVFEAQQNWKGAAASYQASIAIFDEMRRQDPNVEDVIAIQAPLHNQLAECYAAMGRWDDAIRAAEDAMNRLRELAVRRPLMAIEESQRKENIAKLESWRQRLQR